DMDTSKLSAAAETAAGLSSSLSDRAGQVGSAAEIPSGTWSGGDAQAAGNLLGEQPPPLFDASDAFNRGRAALEDLVTGIDSAKEHLRDAHDLVSGTGIVIGGDGTVTTPTVDSPTVAEHNAELARQARQIIDEAVDMAGQADQAAVDALSDDEGIFGLPHLVPKGEELEIIPGVLGYHNHNNEGNPLEFLNGGWQNYVPAAPLHRWTEEEWDNSYLGGLLHVSSEHGDGGSLGASLGWDGENVGLGIGGDPQRKFVISGPQTDVGPVNVNWLGSVEGNDSMIPSLGWAPDENGRTRLLPKVGVPGVSWSSPNVSVDLAEVGGGIADAAGAVNDVMPWNR
ncbi:MAG: hypothetical protein ACRDXX_03135, partial [Stackebrandtia sp.]